MTMSRCFCDLCEHYDPTGTGLCPDCARDDDHNPIPDDGDDPVGRQLFEDRIVGAIIAGL
jgi:hypothetical protein